ncbi:arginase family protein [Dickeya dianthicola]|uniref:arginase family protein n=1 Tax=Dickeya dianthicola TaxID=204039 RepID=UPI001869292A|nr:arginase family protein [Dickeya dianthicola]QOL13457.1 arginase family protein [Dickeya dianthicola]
MSTPDSKTLRLIFPQWQGGNNPPYYFGSQLLNWLSPEPTGPVEQVEVAEPDGEALPLEDGIVARNALLRQARNARALISRHSPDRLVILGGDCFVNLAPFAYLNERYGGELAVLWVDAHPDVMTPREFRHAHAMVLGNLLGEGDHEFADTVEVPVKPENVMFAGLGPTTDMETKFIKRLDLKKAGPAELADTSAPVLEWLRAIGAKHLAVHLDLDVLDVNKFHALYFGKPDAPAGAFDGITQGKMTMQQIVRLLGDVAQAVDIVGLGITEHLPWDAIALKNMLASLPLIGER